MELTQTQIDKILEEALPDVTASLKQSLLRKIEWQVEETAQTLIREHVTQWIQAEIIPEIDRQLTESRDGLVSIGTNLGPMVVEKVTQAMADAIGSKLEASWERRKIFEALLT